MPKININFVFKQTNGKDMPIDFTENSKPATLGYFAIEALLMAFEGEKIDAGEKIKRYELAKKIMSAKTSELDLSSEDFVKVKLLIGKAFTPLVVGQAMEVLKEK